MVAELLKAGRALAAPPPAMADAALVADPRLVGEPQLDPLVGMLRADGFYLLGEREARTSGKFKKLCHTDPDATMATSSKASLRRRSLLDQMQSSLRSRNRN